MVEKPQVFREGTMEEYSVKAALSSKGEKHQVYVQGWVRTKRESKGVVFLELNDGSCQKNLQCVAELQGRHWEEELARLGTGAGIRVLGNLLPSPGKGQNYELQISELLVFGLAGEDYPMQKKRHGFEFLREIAHLRPRTNTFGAIGRIRNSLSMAVHNFFQEKGFYWVHTPIITSSDAEGAGQMFRVTTLNGKEDPSEDFFGQKTHLTVSGQLAGETYALAMGKIYTFGPTFRAENSHTSRHLSEFWMIEPEMAFTDLEGNMDLAEEFIVTLIKSILEKNPDEMEFFNQWVEKGIKEKLENLLQKRFKRIPYSEAISLLKEAKTNFEFPVEWGIDLQSEHERYLTDEIFKGPVILFDYPKDIKAFYMKQNDDKKTVAAMDVLVPRLGEIIGGSQREDDLAKLSQRMEEMGLDQKEYDWYLDLRRFGSVPHSGFGLGFERLIQYVTGMQNIRDVIPFPRTPGSIKF
jgi:asparaginyl-tRNA synthetase